MIKELTPEQEQMRIAYRAEAFKIGTCTDPADRPKAEANISVFYERLNKPKPVFFWHDSPKACLKFINEEKSKSGQADNSYPLFLGSVEIYWQAFYDFCRKIGVKYKKEDDELLDVWINISKSCFWWWPFEKAVVVSERPLFVSFDDRERPHCDNAMAVAFRDGSGYYAWHGVRVSEKVIMRPLDITPKEISEERNVEVRRVMVERYGAERYLFDGGAKLIHEDEFGKLYRTDLEDDEPLVMVQVRNSTAEPDGHFKDYMLRVAPDLRPLGKADGQPQKLTARNAVASTFGMTGEEYQPGFQS